MGIALHSYIYFRQHISGRAQVVLDILSHSFKETKQTLKTYCKFITKCQKSLYTDRYRQFYRQPTGTVHKEQFCSAT